MEHKLKNIIAEHLKVICSFDGYTRFGVSDGVTFRNLMATDPAFGPFHLDNEKYVTARIGGNLITSLHRKIGDIYENLTQEILSEKLGLKRNSLNYSLELSINGTKQTRSTDGRIIFSEIPDKTTSQKLKYLAPQKMEGIALEVRSCYQIGDSKRIQADRDMALALKELSLHPVMLVFCTTSLKSPLIRLRQYWDLKEGLNSFSYLKELTGFDLYEFLCNNKSFIKPYMESIFNMM